MWVIARRVERLHKYGSQLTLTFQEGYMLAFLMGAASGYLSDTLYKMKLSNKKIVVGSDQTELIKVTNRNIEADMMVYL